MDIAPGLTGYASLIVQDADTAIAAGTGDVAVLATPRLIALCEEATCKSLVGVLPEGCTTVGVRVQFDHLSPIGPGSEVSAEATLEKIEGRRLIFTVAATDHAGLVGAGRVTRVLVEIPAFLAKAR